MRDDFAIFIISHGRASNMTTADTIKKHGYSGNWYVVLDDLDMTAYQYIERFGKDHVIVFDKMKYVSVTDTGMLEPMINFAVFARNAVEQIARDMGLKYFGLFDDDILRFRFRYLCDEHLLSKPLHNLDEIIDVYLKLLSIDNVECMSFGTAVSYAGGMSSYLAWQRPTRRMCYQAMLRKVDSVVVWGHNLYEDVTTPLLAGRRGRIWLQPLEVEFDMMECGRGSVSGGNSSVYNTMNPVHQVFFPILSAPDCNYIIFKDNRYRTKLRTSDYVLPKIISGGYKK